MKIVRSLIWLVLVFAVGVGGVMVGTKLRERNTPDPVDMMPPELALPNLPYAEPFPDVALTDSTGHTVTTHELLGGQGAVVLFIDLECSPCTDVVRRWQDAIDHGDVPRDQVWGVCIFPGPMIADYRAEHGVTFAVYSDSAQTFRRDFGIEHFPLQVVVGGSGLVRFRSYDSVSNLDFAELERNLSR